MSETLIEQLKRSANAVVSRMNSEGGVICYSQEQSKGQAWLLREAATALESSRSEAAKLREALPQWRTIETAPKDGTIMLWWRHNVVPTIGWWNDNSEPPGWISEDDDCTPINQQDCTHWMPLPEPPNE